MDVPSDEDWRSEAWGPDTQDAYDHFRGATLAIAMDMFREDSMTYQEDVMFMPRMCFFFYCTALMDYLSSHQSNGDETAASAFLGIVKVRLGDIASGDPDFKSRIVSALEHVGMNQARYGAPISVYGNFDEKASELILKIAGAGQFSEGLGP